MIRVKLHLINLIILFNSKGEEVALVEIISTSKARGQVEKWLLELETEMKKSIRCKIKESYDDYPNKIRHQWVLDWPGQCVRVIQVCYLLFLKPKLCLGSKYFIRILDIRNYRSIFYR